MGLGLPPQRSSTASSISISPSEPTCKYILCSPNPLSTLSVHYQLGYCLRNLVTEYIAFSNPQDTRQGPVNRLCFGWSTLTSSIQDKFNATGYETNLDNTQNLFHTILDSTYIYCGVNRRRFIWRNTSGGWSARWSVRPQGFSHLDYRQSPGASTSAGAPGLPLPYKLAAVEYRICSLQHN